MPYVNIQPAALPNHKKAGLVRDVAESLVRVLGKEPEHIHVVLQEVSEEDWALLAS